MSEHEQSELLSRLERMEESLSKIQACLLGEFGGQVGLIPEHRQCQAEFKRKCKELDDLRVQVENLNNYKREMVSYGAGILFVVVVLWEVLKTTWLK